MLDVCAENIDTLRQRDKEYYERNKDARLASNKVYCKEHKDKILEKKKEYYEANKHRILEYHQNRKQTRNEQKRTKRKTDDVFAVCEALKVRVHRVLKDKKSDRSWSYIGCSKNFLKSWIEFQFDTTMTWDNYGNVWHIDHVIPIAQFNMLSEIQRLNCFHWSNLRPLEKKVNMMKSDKLLIQDICRHNETLCDFITKNGYQTMPEKALWLREELRYGNNPEDEFAIWMANEMGNPQPSS